MDIKKMIRDMTLVEKASLCSGADFWHTETIDRIGLKAIMVSDGPYGLRKQEEIINNMGWAESILAVGFPTAASLANSFDRDLVHEVGNALGDECQAEDVAVLLGPGINMKRSPLGGRNFEYYSEDPYLAGEIGAAFVNGVQEKNIGTSLKHFAANNQETDRMVSDSVMDERTLHEIYLPAFETVVKKAKPLGVMAAYNKLNGTHCSENKELLTDILRKRWGYEGMVVTDWGAVKDRAKGIAAGQDLEMPGGSGRGTNSILSAIKAGTLSEEELNAAFRPNTKLMFGETIANPALTVLDIELFAKTAHAHGVPLIIDNTFPTPVNCRPFEWGADIVTHSTTKYMDGHGAAVGGAIVDSGKFDWMAHANKYPGLCTPDESYHGVTYTERFGLEGAFITKATAQLMRDFGSIPAPMNAYLLNVGLETLPLRMARHCENGRKVAEYLQNHPKVAWVKYPGLPGDAYKGNWNPFVFSLSIPIATWLAAKVFIPLYRSVNSVSAYHYLEMRFGYWARCYVAVCYLLTQLARIGSILLLLALPLNTMFGWDIQTIIICTGIATLIYTLLGGIAAVVWTLSLIHI